MFGYCSDEQYILTIIPINSVLKSSLDKKHSIYYCERAIAVSIEHKDNGQIKLVFPAPLLRKSYFSSREIAILQNKDELTGNIYGELHSNGQKMIEYLDNHLVEWYESGKKRKDCYIKNNRLHGRYQKWHKNGKKLSEGYLRNGEFYGIYQSWYSNGQIECILNYMDDKLNGLCHIRYDNGRKASEGYYYYDKLNGSYREWYQNGRKKSEQIYVNGLLHGKSIEWDENGNRTENFYQFGCLKPIEKNTDADCIVCHENIEPKQEYYQCKFEHSFHPICINSRPEWVKKCVYCQNTNIFYIN